MHFLPKRAGISQYRAILQSHHTITGPTLDRKFIENHVEYATAWCARRHSNKIRILSLLLNLHILFHAQYMAKAHLVECHLIKVWVSRFLTLCVDGLHQQSRKSVLDICKFRVLFKFNQKIALPMLAGRADI